MESVFLSISYGGLLYGIWVGNGHFHDYGIGAIFISYVFLILAVYLFLKKHSSFLFDPILLLFLLLLFSLFLNILVSPALYLHQSFFAAAYRIFCAILFAGAFIVYKPHSKFENKRHLMFRGACGAAFLFRVWLIFASPSPVIDVFAQFQESAQHILAGLNPYTTLVSDVYQGTRDYGYHMLGYAYPPSNLYLHVLFYFLFKDIRFGYVLMELIAAFSLYKIIPTPQKKFAELITLLFLYNPRGLFVLEQAWSEPFILGFFALFVYLFIRNQKSSWLPVLYGYLVSLKQYLVFFIFSYLILEKRKSRIFTMLGIIILTTLPFWLWDAHSFLKYGLLFQFKTPFREDGLTLVSVFYRWFGWTAGKGLAVVLGFAINIFWLWRFKKESVSNYLYLSTLTLFSMFLMGSQAFCNYYYLVGNLLLFILAIRLRELNLVESQA